MIVSTTEVRALVQLPAGVSDVRLQTLIKAAEQEIVSGCGPNAFIYTNGAKAAQPTVFTVKADLDRYALEIQLPRKVASFATVTVGAAQVTDVRRRTSATALTAPIACQIEDQVFVVRADGAAFMPGRYELKVHYFDYDDVRKQAALTLVAWNALDLQTSIDPSGKKPTTDRRNEVMERIIDAETGVGIL